MEEIIVGKKTDARRKGIKKLLLGIVIFIAFASLLDIGMAALGFIAIFFSMMICFMHKLHI